MHCPRGQLVSPSLIATDLTPRRRKKPFISSAVTSTALRHSSFPGPSHRIGSPNGICHHVGIYLEGLIVDRFALGRRTRCNLLEQLPRQLHQTNLSQRDRQTDFGGEVQHLFLYRAGLPFPALRPTLTCGVSGFCFCEVSFQPRHCRTSRSADGLAGVPKVCHQGGPL